MSTFMSDTNDARRVWDEWNIRIAVLSSLFFQMILILLSNCRRRTGNWFLTLIIWSFYLLADWIAAFAVGLISSSQTNDCPTKRAVNTKLAAFWAPFLLLHLGGPDAITAFSLEDNELWIRHGLGVLIQFAAVLYVFLLSLPNDYWIPTVLVFVAGTCKYAERTVALYQACLENFKRSLLSDPDPGPNYAQLMEEFAALEDSNVPVKIDIVKETEKSSKETEKSSTSVQTNGESTTTETSSLSDLDIVLIGYRFFNTFKGLVVDHMFSFTERNESRMFFLGMEADKAFKIVEVELNFLYDVLYTKAAAVHCWNGIVSRFICSFLLVLSVWQFASLPKHNMFRFDKIVTYVLLAGGLGLDMVGEYKLLVSDWSIVSVPEKVGRWIIRYLPFALRKQRWSNAMGQYSFISFCLKEEQCRLLNKIPDVFKLKEALRMVLHKKKKKKLEDQLKLKQSIFSELKAKGKKAITTKKAKKIYSARGANVLPHYINHFSFQDSSKDSYGESFYTSIEKSLSDETEYDESLLLWHIATELCYFTTPDDTSDDNREFCKVVSDYMLYLLVRQPTLMSTVAGIAQIRFQDTCEEAKRIFRRWQLKEDDQKSEKACGKLHEEAKKIFRWRQLTDELQSKACKKLLEVKTVVKPKEVKGDRSKSLLFDACRLANALIKMGDESSMWKMMSKIWVELVSYGASHCRASDHMRQLSQGGELITFVWLLMVHFGLGEQFRIEAGHARAKLLVGKRPK